VRVTRLPVAAGSARQARSGPAVGRRSTAPGLHPPDPLLYDISTPIRNLELADSAFTYRTTGTRGGSARSGRAVSGNFSVRAKRRQRRGARPTRNSGQLAPL